ncbi:MAG: hypothetical protein ABIH86_04645 [Planctomycetota bacterium]
MRDRATGQPFDSQDRDGAAMGHPLETAAIVLSLFLLFPWLLFQMMTPPFQIALVVVSLLDMIILGTVYIRRRKRYHLWIANQRLTAKSGSAMIGLPGIIGTEPQDESQTDDVREAEPDSEAGQ